MEPILLQNLLIMIQINSVSKLLKVISKNIEEFIIIDKNGRKMPVTIMYYEVTERFHVFYDETEVFKIYTKQEMVFSEIGSHIKKGQLYTNT